MTTSFCFIKPISLRSVQGLFVVLDQGIISSHYYRPQTELREGNVFTSVCQEFCPGGGVHTYFPQADTP